MSRQRIVPVGIAACLAVALSIAALAAPGAGAGAVAAAPAALEAAFRDLPSTVRTGDVMTIQLEVPRDARCEGSVNYRDGLVQQLGKLSENGRRCRWDAVVPDEARRGDADILVKISGKDGELTLAANVAIERRARNVSLSIDQLPGEARRGDTIDIRLNVAAGASCQGVITYSDGKTQALDPRTEQKERCRWSPIVPADVERGLARIAVTVARGSEQAAFIGSFEVSKRESDPDLLIGFLDLPTTARRDGTIVVRLLVPTGATCTGELNLPDVDNVELTEVSERDGQCRWNVVVPDEAEHGNATVKVTVRADGKKSTAEAAIGIDYGSRDVMAEFQDLPSSVERGDDFDVRVKVGTGATCHGEVTFADGEQEILSVKTEKKKRCSWEVDVHDDVQRGAAVVRVIVVNPDGTQATLMGNVRVGVADDTFKAAWGGLPKTARIGEHFSVQVEVATDSTCSGRIVFADGMRWMLGTTGSSGTRCSWDVDVPVHVSAGAATVEVTVSKGSQSTTLNANLEVRSS